MAEPLDPIIIQVTIPLPLAMIHAALTDQDILDRWMCDGARIEPRVGGAYEVTWEGDTPFVSSGTITRLTPDVDVGFTWRAPPAFDELMNRPEPKTQVYVRLQESPEGIDVTLEHSGWGSGPEWEAARSWHFELWDDRLHRLKDYLLREAYG
ncbi:MAG: SRPBCC family protein [Thermoplasmata archaeon]